MYINGVGGAEFYRKKSGSFKIYVDVDNNYLTFDKYPLGTRHLQKSSLLYIIETSLALWDVAS